MGKFPPAQNEYPIEKYTLNTPPLIDLVSVIATGLQKNFVESTVEIISCPDLRQSPFHLAAAGLSGAGRIADIGGPPYLHPTPKLEKQYSLLTILNDVELGTGSMLGASAGPFHQIGHNSELMPNLAKGVDGEKICNRTHYAEVGEHGQCVSGPVPDAMQDFGLMGNLFISEGRPGPVLKITASQRTGQLNFPGAIQEALKARYEERTVSLGGVFLVRAGKATMHVMPDFCKEPLDESGMLKWLKFYEMDTPLICLSVLHSHDPGLDLRMEHTHCFSVNEDGESGQRGGHYHADCTPNETSYEAYLNTADFIYRIDRPEG